MKQRRCTESVSWYGTKRERRYGTCVVLRRPVTASQVFGEQSSNRIARNGVSELT